MKSFDRSWASVARASLLAMAGCALVACGGGNGDSDASSPASSGSDTQHQAFSSPSEALASALGIDEGAAGRILDEAGQSQNDASAVTARTGALASSAKADPPKSTTLFDQVHQCLLDQVERWNLQSLEYLTQGYQNMPCSLTTGSRYTGSMRVEFADSKRTVLSERVIKDPPDACAVWYLPQYGVTVGVAGTKAWYKPYQAQIWASGSDTSAVIGEAVPENVAPASPIDGFKRFQFCKGYLSQS